MHVAHVDEKNPGVILQARLGASGLQLLRGSIVVCLPLEALFAMAGEINPAFLAPPDKNMTLEQIEVLPRDFPDTAPAA